MIEGAIVLCIAAIGIFIVMNKKKQKKTNPIDTPVTAPPPASPDQEYRIILDSLLKLNILLRKDADLSTELTGEIEAIIDDLRAVTPSMIERYPGETLTYEMKKIGREHLYKTVKEYLDLSLESRKHQLDIFKKTIENLHGVSRRARDIVEKNETAEFKTMANFLAGKFS